MYDRRPLSIAVWRGRFTFRAGLFFNVGISLDPPGSRDIYRGWRIALGLGPVMLGWDG